MRKAVFKARKTKVAQGFYGAISGFISGKAKVEGTKGHIFQHSGEEQLILRVLQYKAYLAAQLMKIFFVVEGHTVKQHLPALGAGKTGYAPK